MPSWPLIYVAVVGVVSAVTFCVYGLDKNFARRGRRRISEQTLHVFALLGGWPGALAGQRFFSHKTRKVRFLAIYWLVVLIHCALVGLAGRIVYA